MNKRIEELLKQSTHDVMGVKQVDQKQFAELIVRECAEVAGCNVHVSGFVLGDLIKEHFGVEE